MTIDILSIVIIWNIQANIHDYTINMLYCILRLHKMYPIIYPNNYKIGLSEDCPNIYNIYPNMYNNCNMYPKTKTALPPPPGRRRRTPPTRAPALPIIIINIIIIMMIHYD